MATLYVTEYSGFNTMAVLAAPPLGSITADYSISITSGSTQTLAFQNTTKVVQIATDAACSIAYGDNPVAKISAHRLAANETRFYIVCGGKMLAVIQNS